VELLLKHGASAGVRTNELNTCLHLLGKADGRTDGHWDSHSFPSFCAENKEFNKGVHNAVRLLVAAGVDVNIPNNSGETYFPVLFVSCVRSLRLKLLWPHYQTLLVLAYRCLL
jgi:hypothetical protein